MRTITVLTIITIASGTVSANPTQKVNEVNKAENVKEIDDTIKLWDIEDIKNFVWEFINDLIDEFVNIIDVDYYEKSDESHESHESHENYVKVMNEESDPFPCVVKDVTEIFDCFKKNIDEGTLSCVLNGFKDLESCIDKSDHVAHVLLSGAIKRLRRF